MENIASSLDLNSDSTIQKVCKKITPTQALRIALLSYRSHSFVGGQGIYIKYLSRALHNMGHSVTVFSGPPYPDLDPEIHLHKVPSLDLYASKNHVRALTLDNLKSFTDTYEWWTMLTGGFAEPFTFGRRIYKLLKNENFDIIHDNQSLCFALLKLQKLGHNVIATVHHPIHLDRKVALEHAINWKYRILIRRWYSFLRMQTYVARKLNHLTTVSESSQRDIKQYFNRPKATTPVIVNGVDTSVFKSIPHLTKVPFRLITTASADQPLKGLSYLLQALKLLKEKYPQVTLIVIGKLKPGGHTENLLFSLKLHDTVQFHSGISTEELVQLYNQAQIAICPSLYEGFGLPAIEAMACGLPVICTNGGALPEVIGDAGIVVPIKDSLAIANAVSTLFDFPMQAEQLIKKGQARIDINFSWSQVAAKLTNYYNQMIVANVDG